MVLSNFLCDLDKATPSPTPSKLSPTLLSSSMPDTINPHYLLATPTATLPTRRSSMPTMLPPTQPLLRLGTPMPSELATPEPLMPSPQPEPQTTSTTQPPTPQTTPTMLAPMLTMLPLMLPALFATLLFQMPSLLLQRSLLVIPQADMLPPPPGNTSLIQLLPTATNCQHHHCCHPAAACCSNCSDHRFQCGCPGETSRPRLNCPSSQDKRTHWCRFHPRIKLRPQG